jgi:hypothetical protein
MNYRPGDEFVGQVLKPIGHAFDAGAMATGAPGVPSRFSVNDRKYHLAKVLETWKESSPCRHSAGKSTEMYLRKHWYRIVTTDGTEMSIYFERQTKRGASPKKRWWVYSMAPASPGQ